MPMEFRELDELTRRYMLQEFENEEGSGRPYRSRLLSAAGLVAFPGLLSVALGEGNEISLFAALNDEGHWVASEDRHVKGRPVHYRVNIEQAAERLAITEFNTWYVRGLSKRLLEEGITDCRVYRAADIPGAPPECALHDGQIYPVRAIYEGHRARYWPEPGNRQALSIPIGPGCRHSISRI